MCFCVAFRGEQNTRFEKTAPATELDFGDVIVHRRRRLIKTLLKSALIVVYILMGALSVL